MTTDGWLPTDDMGSALLSRVRKTVRRALRTFTDEGERAVRIEVVADDVDGGFVVRCLDLPGCSSQGETVDEAIGNIIEAIAGVLEVRMQQEFDSEKPRIWPAGSGPKQLALKIPV